MTMTRRILVVEDEPSIAENIAYSLSTEGFEVCLATTGGEALPYFSNDGTEVAPALVILDVGLPDMSGFDVCREIRSRSTVPVIFLTAREAEIDRVVGLELGADDYVVKPFSPRELVARVRAILRRTAGTSSVANAGTESHVMGPFEIDGKRRRISCAGTVIDLSRYEYGLLELLIEHPGRVYTRDQLMDHVWDEPDASLDRTVDAHIKTLRAKLRDTTAGDAAIVTHRGVGYSLKEDW